MRTSFGEKLRFARERAGLTQEEVSIKVGCSRALINHYENDRKQPRLKNLKAIADALNMSQDFFLDDSIKIYSQQELEWIEKASDSPNHLDYTIVIAKAMEADVSPEELIQFIDILNTAKQKARNHKE